MQFVPSNIPGGPVAIVKGEGLLMDSVQAALDLIATASYDIDGVRALVIDKSNLPEDFFMLRTRLAGEILQKFINYQMKLAIVGDFSGYTSHALADFIRESNRGKDIFFAATEAEALTMLAGALA